MRIIEAPPPNIDAIKKVFPHVEKYKAVFAYGDSIYNPYGARFDPFMIAHEETHSIQQGDDVEGWWTKYLEDPNFRIEQEAEAYKVQYLAACAKSIDKEKLDRYARRLAEALSGPIYGELISFTNALRLIIT
jgi:hypothetical protein